MRVNPMAVIVPANLAADDENKLRMAVWQKVTELLLPRLGKDFSRFEPATIAWNQRLDKPFGVVLGRDDPALFLYYYNTAKSMQQHMIKRHMAAFLENIEPIAKDGKDGVAIYAVEVKGDGKELGAHLAWHLAMIAGELQPDCGLYFATEREAYANDTLEKKVLENMERYALCVVNLVEKENQP